MNQKLHCLKHDVQKHRERGLSKNGRDPSSRTVAVLISLNRLFAMMIVTWKKISIAMIERRQIVIIGRGKCDNSIWDNLS